jgi:hypothetical protein
MLEEKKEVRETTAGLLRGSYTLEPDEFLRTEEERRAELIRQIKEGTLQTR